MKLRHMHVMVRGLVLACSGMACAPKLRANARRCPMGTTSLRDWIIDYALLLAVATVIAYLWAHEPRVRHPWRM